MEDKYRLPLMVFSFILLGVGLSMSARRVDATSKHERLVHACVQYNKHRFDAPLYCKQLIGHCASLDTDQGCFVRLANQPYAHDLRRPNR